MALKSLRALWPRHFFLIEAWGRSRYFQIGAIMLLILILMAIFQPFLSGLLLEKGVKPTSFGTFETYLDPSLAHPFGTDKLGRDWLSLVFVGIRTSMLIAAISGTTSATIGIALGFIAGYKGGWIDTVLRTGTDMVLVIPSLPLLITLALYMPSINIPIMSLLLAAFSWPFTTRILRSQVLSLKERAFVDMARTSHMGDMSIIFLEILPNLLPYLGVSLAVGMSSAMLAEIGLQLIGLGPGNINTLGLMIQRSVNWGAMALGKWWIVFAPVGTLIAFFVSLNLVNIGLEDAFNPRLRAVTGD